MRREGVRAAVRSFRRRFGIRDVTCSAVKDAVEEMGYTLIPFLPVNNTVSVDTVIRTLGLSRAVATAKAFTYADQNYRLVFCRRDLTEEEQLLLLAHEVGHIFLGHMSGSSILGRDVTEEHEANEFSHYLLHSGPFGRAVKTLRRHRKRVLLICAVLVLLIAAAGVSRYVYVQNTYYGNNYVTDTGNKYHRKNCVTIKHSANIRRLTIEEYEAGEYEPCQVCLPDE